MVAKLISILPMATLILLTAFAFAYLGATVQRQQLAEEKRSKVAGLNS